MYVRNVLYPGDYLMPVPLGLLVTLEYDENGCLVHVYSGPSHSGEDLTDKLLQVLDLSPIVPSHIQLKGGTTYVSGVLYNPVCELNRQDGYTVILNAENFVSSICVDTTGWTFYAGIIDSYAAVFRGFSAVKQWLLINKFNILPGLLVPQGLNRDNFVTTLQRSMYPFNPALICYYFVYRGTVVIPVPTRITQMQILDSEQFLTSAGDIHCKLKGKSRELEVDLSVCSGYNLISGSTVLLDAYDDVIFALNDTDSVNYPQMHTCSICGKSYKLLGIGESTHCSDSTCPSRIYSWVQNMLKAYVLPEITWDTYYNLIQNTKGFVLADVLQILPYSEMNIAVTLEQLIRGVVPHHLLISDDTIAKFVNNCNNTLATVLYYVSHVDQIKSDFALATDEMVRLGSWLSNDYISGQLDTISHMPNVRIAEMRKRFNGAPILKSANIFITGTFIHGSISDIKSILLSYSATVTTDSDSDYNCVIVGDVLEDVNGKALNYARSHGISVFSETEFFTRYGIDADLAENL